jgi:hypothetical protein
MFRICLDGVFNPLKDRGTGNGINYRCYCHFKLPLTGNGRIYIMVALADWYILPILPPIGETFWLLQVSEMWAFRYWLCLEFHAGGLNQCFN